MKTVEHIRMRSTIPPVYWADEIEICESAVELSIAGQKLLPPSNNSKNRDLVSGYVYAISGARAGDANEAAHLVFASSTTEETLTKFVQRYGPVLAEADSVRVGAPIYEKIGIKTLFRAKQRWDVLRREQRTLEAALQLFEDIRSDKPDGDALVRAAKSLVWRTSYWVDAYDQELKEKGRRGWQDSPSWMWTAKHQGRAQQLANAMGPLAGC